jgi:hypothetical protein
MNTINMPRFTAENSIYKTNEHHCMANAFDSQNTSTIVQPALPKVCDLLSELTWGAYNEGAYNRGEFLSNVMERAGCFR